MAEIRIFAGLKSGKSSLVKFLFRKLQVDITYRCGLDRISPTGRKLQGALRRPCIRAKGFGSTIRKVAVLELFPSTQEPDKMGFRMTMSLYRQD